MVDGQLWMQSEHVPAISSVRSLPQTCVSFGGVLLPHVAHDVTCNLPLKTSEDHFASFLTLMHTN